MDLIDLTAAERKVLSKALDQWIEVVEGYLYNMPSDQQTQTEYRIAFHLKYILERGPLWPEKRSFISRSLTSLAERLRSLWT